MKKPSTGEQAALAVIRGKGGSCGLIQESSGPLEFIGFGIRRPFTFLRVALNDRIFDEKNFPFQLLMRKGNITREPWAMLVDLEWRRLSLSGETDLTIQCWALIEPHGYETAPQGTEPSIPIGLKAYFKGETGAVIILQDDIDFCKMILAEAESLKPTADSLRDPIEVLA